MVVTAAGIVSFPVLYGINKRRRELGLEPYAFSSIFERLVKLIQILITKASFFRKNYSLSVSDMNDERIERMGRDWNEQDSDSLDYHTQLFSENETEANVIKESDNRIQVSGKTSNNDKSAKGLVPLKEQNHIIPPESRSCLPRRRNAPDEKYRNKERHRRIFYSPASPKTLCNKDAINCNKESEFSPKNHVQVSGKRKCDAEVVIDVRDWDEKDTLNANEVRFQVSMEKETCVETAGNTRENSEENSKVHKAPLNVFEKKNTDEITAQNSGEWDAEKKDGQKVSIENNFGQKMVGNVPKWEALKQKGTENDVDEGLKSCCLGNVSSSKISAPVSASKDNNKAITDEDIKGTIVSQSILDKDLTASCSVELHARDKPNFTSEMRPRAVLYFDESQDSIEVEVNAAILNEILGLSEDNGDSNNIVGQMSADEREPTEILQVPSERQSLSDEENTYGRKDIQRVALTRTPSDSFFCSDKRDDSLTTNRRLGFYRFSGLLPLTPFTRFKDNKEKDKKGKAMKQVGNGTVIDDAAQQKVTREKCKPCETPELKKGKRNRKRKNNKQNNLESPNNLTRNEADDEWDKLDLKQENQLATERGADQEAPGLRTLVSSPKEGTQSAKVEIEKLKHAETSPKHTTKIHADMAKSRIIRFLTERNNHRLKNSPSKNGTDSKDCGARRLQTAVSKTTRATKNNIAGPQDCEPEMRTNTNGFKGCELAKTTSSHRVPNITKEVSTFKISQLAKKTQGFNTVKKTIGTAIATNGNTADPKDRDETKRSPKMSLRKSPRVISARSSNPAHVDCAAKITRSAHATMEDKDLDVLLLYDDVD